MKRLIHASLAVVALGLLCLLTACENDILPQPTFPLDEDAINAALEKTGLPGDVYEFEPISYSEDHIMHVVCSPTETYREDIPERELAIPSNRLKIATISSQLIEGERVLTIIFEQKDVSDEFAWEDWKQQIVFATLLYGGFENEEDVYQAFHGKELPDGEISYQWDAELPGGGYCGVLYQSRTFLYHGVEEWQLAQVTMSVGIYESQALYQRLMEPVIKDNNK